MPETKSHAMLYLITRLGTTINYYYSICYYTTKHLLLFVSPFGMCLKISIFVEMGYLKKVFILRYLRQEDRNNKTRGIHD